MNAFRQVPILLFCLSLTAFPQQSTDTNRRITLDVVVTGKSDKPAPNLQQQDFTILDNKEPRKIVSFRTAQGTTEEPPVEIVLLIDRVNTSATFCKKPRNFSVKTAGSLPSRYPSFPFPTPEPRSRIRRATEMH